MLKMLGCLACTVEQEFEGVERISFVEVGKKNTSVRGNK